MKNFKKVLHIKLSEVDLRIVGVDLITSAVEGLCLEANTRLDRNVEDFIKRASKREKSRLGRKAFNDIFKNMEISRKTGLPLCQDTGLDIVFLEIGRDVRIRGDIYDAVNRGVKKGYRKGYLRKSIVRCPLRRINTGDNIPAIVHTKFVGGSRVRITLMPKGGGAENVSMLRMLKPTTSRDQIKDIIVGWVEDVACYACPPLFVGIGLGGSFDTVCLLAKEALLRKPGQSNKDCYYAKLEEDILKDINKSGIGPQGLGGNITAMDVRIEARPCHIASLPLAINLQCHAQRYKSKTI